MVCHGSGTETRLPGKFEFSALRSAFLTCHLRTSYNVPEQRIMVDFDVEKGRRPRTDGSPPDTCYVTIRPTKTIRMAVLGAYLSNQMAFDNTVLEAISKLHISPPFTLLILSRLS